MSNINGGLSGSGTLRGALGGGGVPSQDVYWDDILNKPNFATVATSGSYNDLVNKPTFANVATSGSYNDLTDKPTIPAAQVNADWNATSGVAEILNKPTIPAAQVNADWNATSGVAEILNKPTLAPVATSGSYNDLTNTPTIPPAQVNADWNATSGVAEILNKPTIPAAQVNADWNAASGVAEILNKPTIPTTASQIDYDNTTSGLQADDVQDAITELKSNLTELATPITADFRNGNYTTNGQQISDTITLSKGVYLVIVKLPIVTSATFSVTEGTGLIDNSVLQGGNYTTTIFPYVVSSTDKTLNVQLSATISCSVSYKERGYFGAIKIG